MESIRTGGKTDQANHTNCNQSCNVHFGIIFFSVEKFHFILHVLYKSIF